MTTAVSREVARNGERVAYRAEAAGLGGGHVDNAPRSTPGTVAAASRRAGCPTKGLSTSPPGWDQGQRRLG